MFDKINKEKSKYETRIILGYLSVGLAFVLYLPMFMAIGPIAFPLIAIPFLGGGIYAGLNGKKIKGISNAFKDNFVKEVLKEEFPEARYDYASGFTEEQVVDSLLLRKRDRFSSEDLIEGFYEGVQFKSSDVTQKEVRGSGKNRKVVTVFKGRFYAFEFNKPFKDNLLLTQPYNYKPFTTYEKVKTESIHFNSEMKIYAENPHEAFYILTPDFMEKLMYFDKKYMDKISFSFKDNHLFVAIDTRKDYFDIKPFKKIDKTILDEYRLELLDIKDLIYTLNLNQKMFK